jgi:hypothetical protein
VPGHVSGVDAVVIGQNIYLEYETETVRLAEVEWLAASSRGTRIAHMYQDHDARVRGIVIYERGRRVSLRQVAGSSFKMNDWRDFGDD